MADAPSAGLHIPPEMPDSQVPAEKVETAIVRRRKSARGKLFLKGSVLLSWVRDHIKLPRDRLLLVLVAHSDMRGSATFRITAGILEDAGIANRQAGYRALAALEKDGAVSVTRKRGCRPVVHLGCLRGLRRKPEGSSSS